MSKFNAVLLFLLGLLSTYRVNLIGKIGISEIFVFLAAPIIFFQDLYNLRRERFLPYVYLALLVCLGDVLSGLINHSPPFDILRGFASPYAIFAGIVVMHRLLRKDLRNLKWLALGFGLSLLLAMFLSRGDLSMFVAEGTENDYKAGVLRMYMLVPLICCPIAGWYYKIPFFYSVAAPFSLAAFLFATSSSGRSTGLCLLATAGLAFMGRKSIKGLRFIKQHFILFSLLVILGGFVTKQVYQHLAKQGTLGEEARKKYLYQTAEGESTLRLLMGGRSGFFASFYAIVDRPIVGYGPWALDPDGYYNLKYLAKFGSPVEYQAFLDGVAKRGYAFIPGHTHITVFWLWYGIFGALFWIVVIGLWINVLRKYIMAIPGWYGYICVWMPSFFWAVFFSPFTERMQISALITVSLFMKAAYLQRLPVPFELMTHSIRWRNGGVMSRPF